MDEQRVVIFPSIIKTYIQVSLFSFVDGNEVSRSVLLGVLLIKSLPSKCISHIKLDRNKIKKKKKTRSVRVEEDERKKKKRKKIQRMTEQRDLPRRGQSGEKRWEA